MLVDATHDGSHTSSRLPSFSSEKGLTASCLGITWAYANLYPGDAQTPGRPFGAKMRAASVRCDSLPAATASQPDVQPEASHKVCLVSKSAPRPARTDSGLNPVWSQYWGKSWHIRAHVYRHQINWSFCKFFDSPSSACNASLKLTPWEFCNAVYDGEN